ncbi:MAG TPA: lysozyme inhibitor LprI family protein, partial [Dongiaceae bacterium]
MKHTVGIGWLSAERGRRLAPLGFVTGLCLMAMPGIPALAASFDCKSAGQPLEKIICGDPDLSKLDEDLAASYGKAKAALSSEGQKILLTGQHDWLAFSRRICKTRLDATVAKLVDQTPADCLKSEYRERIEDLDTAATTVNGFTFGAVDTYQLSPSDPQEPGG